MSAHALTTPRRGTRLSLAAGIWLLPLIFLGLFFFYPLWSILRLGLAPRQVIQVLVEDGGIIWRVVRFTLWQAVLSTLLTLLVGMPAAYLFAHYRFPGKDLLRALTTIPFMLPTVVAAAGFNALLGPRGWINVALMALLHLERPPIPFLNTLAAILVAHVFYNTTIVLRIVGNAWAHLDPRLVQAARVLGADSRRAFREVTWPLLRPAILAASLLVFLFDFTSFGVVLILGGPRYATIEVEIFIQALRMLNVPLAAVLSLIQLLFTLALTITYTHVLGRVVVPVAPRAAEENVRRPRDRREWAGLAVVVGVLILLLVTPLIALVIRSFVQLEPATTGTREAVHRLTLAYYRELFINRRASLFYVPPILAVRNSFLFALTTVVISLGLGLPTAFALARRGTAARVLDPLLMLPLGTSAVTLGLGFLIAFGRPPLNWRTSPWIIPLAHSLVAFPFVVRTLHPALASIPPRLHEAAAVLGAPPWRVWKEVDLPIVARAAVVAGVFAFTVSMGEFGATSMLARPEFPTIPIAIYRFLAQPGALNYGQALAMSTILMAVVTVAILVVEKVRIPGVGEF